jgi:Rad52/22 family double-strand break repair protein
MIARHEVQLDKMDIWAKLAAPLPATAISWRQDGRATQRDGKFYARFVAYVDANTVRERLDGVVPGEWDLTLELLPALPTEDGEQNCSFKARLQILGVIREDVGTGKDYKQAATDAFKRAAVRFGIAHELYSYEQNWVQMDGDGKYAKPIDDPAVAYARRYGRPRVETALSAEDSVVSASSIAEREAEVPLSEEPARGASGMALTSDEPSCPKCGGRMWDNRLTKRNPKAPDYKCRDRSCDGVIWPPKPGKTDKPEPAKAVEETEEIPF